ncbi:hypothetical protein VTO73DRAFT_12308 [Trametes versicolor]
MYNAPSHASRNYSTASISPRRGPAGDDLHSTPLSHGAAGNVPLRDVRAVYGRSVFRTASAFWIDALTSQEVQLANERSHRRRMWPHILAIPEGPHCVDEALAMRERAGTTVPSVHTFVRGQLDAFVRSGQDGTCGAHPRVPKPHHPGANVGAAHRAAATAEGYGGLIPQEDDRKRSREGGQEKRAALALPTTPWSVRRSCTTAKTSSVARKQLLTQTAPEVTRGPEGQADSAGRRANHTTPRAADGDGANRNGHARMRRGWQNHRYAARRVSPTGLDS